MRRRKGGGGSVQKHEQLAIITQEDALHRVTASAPPQTQLPFAAYLNTVGCSLL